MKRLAIEALRLFSLLLIAVVVPCAEASASTVIITDFPPILVLTGAAGTVTVTAQFLGPITSDYTQFPEQGYIEGSIGEMWSVQTDGLVRNA